jgi:uncharacterized protein with gpF-like domain
LENYFNYFTEIEECFRRCRGTPHLLSTLDWALIESWKEAGFPLEAVLAGIERSFDKFQKRPQRFRKVNSLAYCSQEVLRAAEEARTAMAEGEARSEEAPAPPPFQPNEVRQFLEKNAHALKRAAGAATEKGQQVLGEDLKSSARALEKAATRGDQELVSDLEEIENHLAVTEEKLAAALLRAAPEELLVEFRREVEHALASHRRKMSAPQIESLQRQFLKKRLFEHYGVPRLSLFYL